MQKTPSIRACRVADLVQREVATILKKHISDPRLQQLSITCVDVSPDLKQALIYYTLASGEDHGDATMALAKASGFLRKELAKRAKLRYVPKLIFKYDVNLIQAEHLVSLLSGEEEGKLV